MKEKVRPQSQKKKTSAHLPPKGARGKTPSLKQLLGRKDFAFLYHYIKKNNLREQALKMLTERLADA